MPVQDERREAEGQSCHFLSQSDFSLVFEGCDGLEHSSLSVEGDSDEDAFQRLAGIVESFLKVTISSTINIARLLYCVMAIVGAVLWTSRLDRMTGRDLIIGAVILAFVSEFIMPVILL